MACAKKYQKCTKSFRIRKFQQTIHWKIFQNSYIFNRCHQKKGWIQLDYWPTTSIRNFEIIMCKSTSVLYFSNWITNPYWNKCFGFNHKSLFLPTTWWEIKTRCILFKEDVSSRTKLRYTRQKIVNNNIGIATMENLRRKLFGTDDFHGPQKFSDIHNNQKVQQKTSPMVRIVGTIQI